MYYGLHSYQISTQLKIYERFWIYVFYSALQHNHQNTNWGNILWKSDVHPSDL